MVIQYKTLTFFIDSINVTLLQYSTSFCGSPTKNSHPTTRVCFTPVDHEHAWKRRISIGIRLTHEGDGLAMAIQDPWG